MKYELLKLEEFDRFYQILSNNFPTKEIKEYNYMKDTFHAGLYQVLTLKDNDQIVGIMSFYQHDDFRFIDYFAIDGSLKGKGMGSKMLQYFINLDDKMVILEVEHPEDEQSKRRIAFYQRNGLYLNDQFEYFVPPVRNLKHRLYFHLMSSKRKINNIEFEKYYPQILKMVYGIE
ncbi:GNAT family N-acetyltransferase [Erysipelatoclostridium sp. An15]|uniref:GNAT family N-acetyltransferase n=1 Tax=Candidatus Erysipelatoclostridium merdavium TaxID=2838566 RepID=A0A9D1XN29_9FIRM|nr:MULTISPECIES: GNAT family N-acetyltransferase [unclassified Thomasclavelia]OUQ08737.1 GNAT family N-acetyltransferase [Erysipelatoclostridium sp. An15]WRK51908.1 GNAT family N-acetyltransferase [Coprobacillaceae bacterium CR2/5/TPMF4]HIX82538.1 GNAT family N-acetyltransferase [Candidatus Erysipelatoclostridium merdavium]